VWRAAQSAATAIGTLLPTLGVINHLYRRVIMKWEGNRESDNVEDRRGDGGGGGGLGGIGGR
jgi:hypothetical protein